ncbi:MAG: excisionase family DNA-binding protein [Chloroflexi bacterium]|nr:excisionase family DNA-binding protein [Chloroflexota bacterium]
MQPTISVAQAARTLGVSPSTVWRWIKGGRLPAYRVGPHTLRIRPQDVQGMVRPAHATAPKPPPETGAILQRLRTPPTPEELARRQELVARILENRKTRVITPLTTADLIHMSREAEQYPDDPTCSDNGR